MDHSINTLRGLDMVPEFLTPDLLSTGDKPWGYFLNMF